jgi:uncharacterized protein
VDLRKKIARLGNAAPPPPAESADPDRDSQNNSAAIASADPEVSKLGKTERLERLRALIGQVKERDTRTEATRASTARDHVRSGIVPGREVSTENGPLHVVEKWLEPNYQHGKVPVKGALEAKSATVAELALDPCLAEVDLERLLILDTETTGLAGGTGTVPFLIGMAWFEEGALRLEQLLLRNLGEEAPLLHRLAERMARASCILSYNGKSFDWPLLRTRFILNRVPAPAVPPHFDLLHCVRRVFKPRISEVRLCDVEEKVLGFFRENDIPGAEIPGIYLRFVRGGDASGLAAILEHNANDVIALAALLGKVARHFETVQTADDPVDHLAFAKVAARAQNAERALGFARAAVEGAGSDNVAVDALVLTARLSKRYGDAPTAVDALHKALGSANDAELASQINLELAKLYEHKLRDPERAYQHALASAQAEEHEAHSKRLARLEKRNLAKK